MASDLSRLEFGDQGLIPAIIQDARSGDVLTLAYMNQESLERTLETGYTWFWSRSRGQLWNKGATSGHVQRVRRIQYDCDADALLVKVDQSGLACHKGFWSCFHHDLFASDASPRPAPVGPDDDDREYGSVPSSVPSTDQDQRLSGPPSDILQEIAAVLHSRRTQPQEGSYTSNLFLTGLDRILKKVGEEAGEVIIAAKNARREEITWEMADLWFHTLMVLEYLGIGLEEVLAVLRERRQKSAPGGHLEANHS
ncbi:MAG: bifunctional phosphoribosyl-AMP cyclohydrolase/phosphoribosyl-ATP diphosphatase HisIE [Firmicutes bacterium]|nr:bifunctional phosphoribosyl-AMP cyclohydrolase/phosphoribosyl-ATP diphosphatase HisIE [Bacillota bacterium]MCL5040079.1 bifunctional phosphoribosyl-AMP cyclohydrolase/phosphoribosyl-ATP diphosphatase HisIE [Bacillota bacterium]